ncbi:WD repeat-containing protein ATCSA-1 [Jatropha curcas]|uniref:WD repeat-containing protein ATCSA-1 n=1 Tax=Jatropha curcas TaxID=180498 RepID=UPI00189309A7|nr:WD repeat-containing protein ATCSA-1 [Jatropha curcas]
MWREIRDREAGKTRPISFTNRVKSNRIANLQLSNYKDIVSPHRGSVNSLQVDLTEGRYLLSGASDASAAVFDIQRAADYEGGGVIAKHKSIFVVDKRHEAGHKYSIASAIWYPVDTGLFVTGSYDHYIKVWDTNSTQVVMHFKMPGRVYRTAMSPLATSHMLIAAGTEDVQVRLCDIASGAFAHTLSGHRASVMSVEWSTSSEWILVTGGFDGAIRFWDIRRAGCFRVLNQTESQLGRRPPILSRSITNKAAQKKSASGNEMRKSPLGRTPVKGPVRRRLHPGMSSMLDSGAAHFGAVTGLKMTEDGMYILSAGSDSRMRLWDIESGCNTLVNFETARLQTTKPLQLATTQDSSLVFVPCMTTVKAFDVWSGRTFMTFRGHYEEVNCCWFNSQDQVKSFSH